MIPQQVAGQVGNSIIQKVESKHQDTTDYQEIFPRLQAALTRSGKATEYLKSRNIHYIKLEIRYNGGSHYKSLKHCIIFPLKDESGNFRSLYGRAIAPNGKHYYTANRKGLYPNYPKAEIYHFSQFNKKTPAISRLADVYY